MRLEISALKRRLEKQRKQNLGFSDRVGDLNFEMKSEQERTKSVKRTIQGVALATGIGLLAGAVSAHNDALKASDLTTQYAQSSESGLEEEARQWNHGVAWTTMEQKGNLAAALYGIGASVLAGSITWIVLDLRAPAISESKSEAGPGPRATLSPLPGGGSVLVQTSF
jgi:hypothetical protein